MPPHDTAIAPARETIVALVLSSLLLAALGVIIYADHSQSALESGEPIGHSVSPIEEALGPAWNSSPSPSVEHLVVVLE
jgi:hypothetical protein